MILVILAIGIADKNMYITQYLGFIIFSAKTTIVYIPKNNNKEFFLYIQLVKYCITDKRSQ